jgi:hypothetical protein
MRFIGLAAFAAASLLVAAPAAAQVTEIQVSPGKAFKHKPSGIVVASEITGIARTGVAQFDDKQLDVIVDYRAPADQEVTTVYLFRNVTGDVPVWFDRIQRTIESNPKLGTAKLAIPPAAFTPVGQSSPAGLRVVYSSTGAGWTSSAAAITSTGEWYVAIRSSSKTLTPLQLLGRLEQSFAAIRWPKEMVAAPAVAPIADCASPLPQGADAQAAPPDPTMAVAAAIVAATDTFEKAKPTKPVPAAARWCREPTKIDGAGVYRPNAATDSYLIAYQDAGRGIWVGKNLSLNQIASELSKEPTFTVELIDVDHRAGYGGFKSLPNIAQALWAAQHGQRAYSIHTWGKDRTLEINSDTLK